jgi:hypothetical protein
MWGTAILALIIVIVIYVLWNDVRYKFGLYTPSKWYCQDPNANAAPLRRNRYGDIECMSLDGKSCIWSEGKKCTDYVTTDATKQNNLSCGAAHKAAWGITGYNDAGHWCSMANANIPPFADAYFKKWE